MISGRSVFILVSDPCDFVTAHGAGPFRGQILKAGTISARSGWSKSLSFLIRLDSPLVFENEAYEYLVASPSHLGEQITDILKGAPVHCGFVRIAEDRAISTSPFDMNWWQGGGGLLGTIELLNP